MPSTHDRLATDRTILPKARDSEIVTQEVGDDLLVYDLVNDKAHHLNKGLAYVWRRCDGEKTIAELSDELSERLGLDIDSDYIWLALTELDKAKLLTTSKERFNIPDVSRREVLFKYALPSLAMPVVVSLVAPVSVNAQSCAPGLEPV